MQMKRAGVNTHQLK